MTCAALAAIALTPAAHASLPGDGGVISFLPAGQATGNPLIASVNADGSNLHEWWPASLPTGASARQPRVSDLAYSPDGSKLAFIYAPQGGLGKLWITSADGSNAHEIGYANTPNVQWSADGKSLYLVEYSIDRATDTLVARIVAKSPNGSGDRVVLTAPGDVNITGFRVSAQGDIAYITRPSHGGEAVFHLWHGTSGLTTELGATPAGYDFSPDGKSLMYTVAGGVCVQPVTAGASTNIALPGVATDVAWSPDGTRFVYATGVNSTALSIADLTGKTLSTSNTSFTIGGHLTWQPRSYTATSAPVPTADRMAGADRTGTAINASRLQFSDHSAPVAVLSRSDTFADALSGSGLAAEKHGPLLLTGTGSLDPAVIGELHRVLAPNATVYLLGGNAALSPAVEQAVRKEGFTPRRLQGADRFHTSLAIANEITPAPRNIYIATGRNYPDALAAGAAAGAKRDSVVLLTDDNVVPADVRTYIDAAKKRDERPSVTLVGGPAANALAGRESTDFASWNEVIGKDRYETAAMLASTVGNAHQTVALATGSAWPDALAGGAAAAAHNAPLLLSDGPTVPQSELAKISSLAYQAPNEILVFGGTAAVPNAAITALEAATGRTGWSLQVNRLMPPLP